MDAGPGPSRRPKRKKLTLVPGEDRDKDRFHSRLSTQSGYLRLYPPNSISPDRNRFSDPSRDSYGASTNLSSGGYSGGNDELTSQYFDTDLNGSQFEMHYVGGSSSEGDGFTDITEDERNRGITHVHSIFESEQEYANGSTEFISNALKGLPPIHAKVLDASWKGQLDKLHEVLTNVSTGELKRIINCQDVEGRTALIIASAFGYSQVVQFLIQNGAMVDVWDKSNSATPISCAAACGSLPVLEILIAHGADVNAGLKRIKTPLHWSIQCGSEECVKKLLDAGAVQNSFNFELGTPLHFAASLNQDSCLKLLLQNGATVALRKGANLWTALHCAAAEGSVDCIELLVKGGSSVEARDSREQTPLHIAAGNGDAEATSILLELRANVNARDCDGRTPLHRAVTNKGTGCVDCLLQLLERRAEIDAQDKLGYTALHLAAVNNSSHFAAVLLQFGADVTLRTKSGQSVLGLLVKKMPHVIRYVRESLDNALSINNNDPNDAECELKLDFRPMIANTSKSHGKPDEAMDSSKDENMQRETEFLTCLVKTGHKSFLSHPLIEAFIVLKWQKVRVFFWLSLIFYTSMVLTYTVYIYDVYVKVCPLGDSTDLPATKVPDNETRPVTECDAGMGGNGTIGAYSLGGPKYCDLSGHLRLQIIWFLLVLFAINMALKEVFQMIQGVRKYVMQLEHWMQWFLLATMTMTVSRMPSAGLCLEYWRYPTAATGIFVAWCLMLLKVGRFPALGIYVQMLGKVIQNFGLFISAYACLLFGFAMSFCVLFPKEPSFYNIPLSLLKVLTMMVGELNYEDLFYSPERNLEGGGFRNKFKEMLYPVTAHILFAGFVLIITIVMMNLLVGLAVHDIQSLERGARLNRLLRQTSSISDLESFLFSKGLHFLLPNSIGSFLRKRALLVPSSYKWTFFFRPNDGREKRLPKKLLREALCLASARQQLGRKPSELRSNRRQTWKEYNFNLEHVLGDLETHICEKNKQELEAAVSTIKEHLRQTLTSLPQSK